MAERDPAPAATGHRSAATAGAALAAERERETSLAAVLGAYRLFADGVESAEVVGSPPTPGKPGITLRQIARMANSARLTHAGLIVGLVLRSPAGDGRPAGVDGTSYRGGQR